MAVTASDLRAAIGDGAIHAYFQPQIDLPTREVVAAEALARWTHPIDGPVSPAEFIPAAEEFGLVRAIGEVMLDAACAHLQEWHDTGIHIEISINVSPLELSDPDFCSSTLATLDRHDIPTAALTVELTETRPMPADATTLTTLAHIREAGIRISVDDYGAGFWAIRHLHDLRATELKVDRALIQGGYEEWLAQVVAEAHDAGARVVAEGIETDEHLQTALDLECDRGQGYLFGAPIPPSSIQAYLS